MTKTPYEIRLETLRLAFDILNQHNIGKNGWEITPIETTDVIQEALVLRNFIDSERIVTAIAKVPEDGRRTFFIDLGDIGPRTTEKVIKKLQEEFKKLDAREAVEGGPVSIPEPLQAEDPTLTEAEERAKFVEKLKSDGSACCGGTGGDDCECNR